MEIQNNFNFDDFDFDFLTPSSSKQDATNCSTSIEISSSEQPQKKICKVSSTTKNKRSRLAERICNTDLVVRQQADLQQSVNEIKNLYAIEKQQRIQIELKSASWHKENEELRHELEEWKLKCDQLEARVKENIPTVDVRELVIGYVRVAQKLSDQCSYNALHKRDLINLCKLKAFCTDNKIHTFKRTLGVPKVNKSVECFLWTTNPELVNKPDTCTRATQCIHPRTQEQGIQCKPLTLSCGTMTTSILPGARIDAATIFPEPKQLPSLREMLNNSIKAWDINPISPIIDILEPATKETQPISPFNDSPESPTHEMNPISPNNDAPETFTEDIEPISPTTDPAESFAITTNPISPINNSPESQEMYPISPITDSLESQEMNPISPITDSPESQEMYPISPITDPPEAFAIRINPISPITDSPEALAIKINPISPINAPTEQRTQKPLGITKQQSSKGHSPLPRRCSCTCYSPLAVTTATSTTQERIKETKTVGTCTILCNVLTNIDDVLQLPKIKRCDSRPPSRSMFSSVKDEMSNLNLPYGGLKDYFSEKLLSNKSFGEASSISNFTPDMFEELWQLFGQMVLGLLQRRSTHPNTRKEEFNSWLPKMYEACQNFEHEILLQTLPMVVPCSSASSSTNDSVNGHNTNQKDYVNQHTDPLPKTKSIGTNPIKQTEFENVVIDGEKDNNSNNEKTFDNNDIRRIRLFSESSMFRPIDAQENPKIIKLSNTSNANISIDKSSNETAVNFLSTLSTFKNVCGNSLEDLDESEMELLASANCPPHRLTDLESTSLQSNEDSRSTATDEELELEVDKSLELINVTNETDNSIVDKSSESMIANIESDVLITESGSKDGKIENTLCQFLTERSSEILIENDSYEEDDIFDNLIIDDTITSDISSNDKVNIDCSVKSAKLVLQQNVIKNDSTLQSCSSRLSTINELFDDIPKSPGKRTRKRKLKTDACQNSLNPCKRSARLAEKRLLDENKSMFDTPMIIGKYTTSKYKQGPATNIHDSAKNENCDKCKPPLSRSSIMGPIFSDHRIYAPIVPDLINQRSATCPFTNNLQPKLTPPTTTALSIIPKITDYAENANHYNLIDSTQINDNTKHKEPSKCVASANDFESPTSPQPSQDYDEEQFKNDSIPIQIPLNLRKSAVPVGSNSLLENLMKKEKQKMAKANKQVEIYEEKLIREMNTKLTEYLQSSQEYEVRNLCYDLQNISQNQDLFISALLDSATLKLIENSQEQLINTRFMNALQHLQEMYKEFLTQFLSELDIKLFTFNQSMKPKLSESLNLLKIYLATIQLRAAMSASSDFKNPARVIIAKILYIYQKDMPRLVYEVLCQFPTVLPHRDEKTYDHSDPLITVIKHELMNYKYDMYDGELCSRQLLSKLRYEYHFEVYKPLQQDVLNQLINKLESGQLKHLQLSFAVFCKRMIMPKCLKDVINGRLLPLVNTYYDRAKLSSDYDERIAALFTCMSTVLKSFVLETDISACVSVFRRFLYSIKRPCVQEAAVQAIIRLQRYGFNLCSEALKDFQPNYTLQPLTVAMLRSFTQRRIQYKKPH